MNKNVNYRPDIDGLRAVAIIIVVFYHASLAGFSGGFVGVDVFFILSGFLITQLLNNELKSTGDISFKNFYARRILRLFPALAILVLTTLTLWVIFFLGVPEDTRLFIKSVVLGQFGFSNILFHNSTHGYFHHSSDELPLLHFWSLSIEEQFYFVWPFFMWFFGSKLKKIIPSLTSKNLIPLAMAPFIIVSFIFSIYFLNKGNVRTPFYMMPLRAWELGLGAMLAFYIPYLKEQSKWLRLVLSFSGLALIAYGNFTFTVKTLFPGLNALFPTVGTILILIAGSNISSIKDGGVIIRFLASKPMVGIGLISYSWYLWHWPFLAMLKIYNHGSLPSLFGRISVVIISALIAYLSLRFIERPVRHGPFFINKGSKNILLGGLGVSVFISILAASVYLLEKSWIIPKWENIITQVTERSVFEKKCADNPLKYGSEDCKLSNGNLNKDKVSNFIYVWGDSHAIAIFPMIEEFIKKKSQSGEIVSYLYSSFGTPPFAPSPELFLKDNKSTQKVNRINAEAIENITSIIRKNPNSRHTLFYAFRMMSYVGDKNISNYSDPFSLDKDMSSAGTWNIFKKSFLETLNILKSIGIERILIFLPYPEFESRGLRCLELTPEDCYISRNRFEKYREKLLVFLESIQRNDPQIRLFDATDSLCSSSRCYQKMKDGMDDIIVTYDENHPSVSASKYLTKTKINDLEWLIFNN